MTITEIKEKYADEDGYVSCCTCPLLDKKGNCSAELKCGCDGYTDAYDAIQRRFESTKKEQASTDSVNHPSHYNREDGIECLEEMEIVFGKEFVKNFCLANIWKYRYRAADKNGEEDIKKSDFYMKKYAELCKEVL